MNKAFCNTCQKLVPVEPVERDGHIFLAKQCPDCGTSETYISNNAERYFSKRKLDVDYEYAPCELHCKSCGHRQVINAAFVNVTNRCNANCPICFDNVPGLGFEYEPPMEYFEKLFKGLAELSPPPSVNLFGGEPTVREDLFDIIKLAKSNHLRVRLYTNGLKLANEEYCKKLADSKVHIIFSYDGSNPNTYEQLRGNAKFGDLKRKGIDNIGKYLRRGRISVIWVMSKDLNEGCIEEFMDFFHERRDFIGQVYIMPLCHTWSHTDWNFNPSRITTEDIEDIVAKAFPDYNINFLPLGFVNQLASLAAVLGKARYGAHPNCESLYYLLSDGEKYVPMEHYLKGTAPEAAASVLKLEKRLAAREERWKKSVFGRLLGGLHLRNFTLRMLAFAAGLSLVRRHVKLTSVLEGKGIGKLWHLIALPVELAFRKKGRVAMRRHTRIKKSLMMIVLPLEDKQKLETDRLQRCPTAQAYYDPREEKVKFISMCSWKLFNKEVLRSIADYYAAQAPPKEAGNRALAT